MKEKDLIDTLNEFVEKNNINLDDEAVTNGIAHTQPDTEVDVMEEPLHISAEALFKCQCKTKELLTSQQAHWLRSEIEKLEETCRRLEQIPTNLQEQEHVWKLVTLYELITRYKEELLD